MVEFAVILLVILGLLIILGLTIIIIISKKKKEDNYLKLDYYSFFIMGICFLPIGVIFVIIINNPGFLGMSGLGAFYLTISLVNRDKWKKL